MVSVTHNIKLTYRIALFLAALALYIYNPASISFSAGEKRHFILVVIWPIYVADMVLSFFPINFESIGCQKQFAENFSPKAQLKEPKSQKQKRDKSAAMVAIAWIIFNAAIGALYFFKLIDEGILLLISLVFSFCDMICIMFFCPFQLWFMKNKCCVTCRIYNWGYAMMFTPLIFIKSLYTWSLVALSLGVLLKWEITYRRHPQRFSETTNDSLSCANCEDKLCRHKKSLWQLLKR
ncbi:MAG: hypothetical protein GX025_07990 [Clostridiales bacterium]|nr:hypothetical protein [Clostridiales bacterium]